MTHIPERARRANTLKGSRRNIEEHYDAGNAMYRLFLDPTMTYSSGIHQPGTALRHLDPSTSRQRGLQRSAHVLRPRHS